MIPSVDAYLVDALGFRRDVRRLPITELGCVGGAAALARAHDFLRGYPDAHVLVVAVELPSLSLQRNDTIAGQPGRERAVRRRRRGGGAHAGGGDRRGRARARDAEPHLPAARRARWGSTCTRMAFTR